MDAASRPKTPPAAHLEKNVVSASLPYTPASLPPTSIAAVLTTPTSPVSATHSAKISDVRLTPRASAYPLTGAAALADARRAKQQEESRTSRQTTPNPGVLALHALIGRQGTSKPSDAPSSATTKLSDGLQSVAEKIDTFGAGEQSESTAATTSNTQPAMTTTAAPADATVQFTEEPESMEDGEEAMTQGDSDTRPFTYPGPRPTVAQSTPTRREETYDSGQKSAKRHKCPYCATDFTRHHNLKSHLLTHSQEKPYVCSTCNARFRRLHDLKRHTKLHTGERPHICNMCGRKFARGDALARHNKGPGGCANRKSSFGAEDGDEGMEDYDDEDEEGEEGEQPEDQGRRASEPSRKRPRNDTGPDSSPYNHQHQPTTYPPAAFKPMRGTEGQAMGPPAPSSKASPIQSNDNSYSSQYYSHLPAVYAPTQVTESPRPLSPRSQDQQRLSVSEQSGLRNRSASLSSNYQYSRNGHAPMQPSNAASHAPQLPSLPSLTVNHHVVQPQTVVGPPSFPTHQHTHPHVTAVSNSNSGSLSSHGHSSSGSMREIIGTEPQDIMTYVRYLEQRFTRMQDEYELRIGRLQADVIELKSQMFHGR